MSRSLVTLVALATLTVIPSAARAHCDALDGPVVTTARTALETGKLAPVLAWVRPQDEAEVKAAFQRSAAVRKLGPQARELADRSFFETVVRVHRAGEGAPFTGLKPAGLDLGPAIPAADRALVQRSPDEVERVLVEAVRHGLHRHFAAVASRARPGEDVAAGRAYVEGYVPWVHWVEGVYAAATGGGAHGAAERPHAEPAERAHAEPAAHAHGH